jgi:hypothetical protein
MATHLTDSRGASLRDCRFDLQIVQCDAPYYYYAETRTRKKPKQPPRENRGACCDGSPNSWHDRHYGNRQYCSSSHQHAALGYYLFQFPKNFHQSVRRYNYHAIYRCTIPKHSRASRTIQRHWGENSPHRLFREAVLRGLWCRGGSCIPHSWLILG